MPAYKRSRTTAKTAKKRSKKNTWSVVKGPAWSLNAGTRSPASSGFPAMVRSTLTYRVQSINLDPGIGGLAAAHVFAANGLFDPDITGIGHQPVGFDQMMAMYDHYVVTKAKIVAEFVNIDASNRQTAAIAIVDDSTTYTDIRRYIENGSCAFTMLDVAETANAQKTLTMEVNPLTWQGRKGKLSDPELKGNAASNPSELCSFQLVAEPLTSTDSAAVLASVTIYYDTTFFERKKTDLS